MKKWEIRFYFNGELKTEVIEGNIKERDVRKAIIDRYSIQNSDIQNVSGAFDSLPGKKLFLGTHAINSSLDLGMAYAKSGNKYYALISPLLEEQRKVVETKSGTPDASQAIENINKYFINHGLGHADIIRFCKAKGSKDSDIDLDEPIVWNDELPELIKNADLVILNGKTKNASNPCTYKFLKDYCDNCKTHKMRIDSNYIYVDEKRIEYLAIYSSSNGTRAKYWVDREKQWNGLFGKE